MRRILLFTAGSLALLFAAIQLIPVERSNPPVEQDLPAPPDLKALLRRSCYDCHSNETRWPWYSRIAPVSWRVAKDVREAREEMNFSTWNRYDPKKQRKLKEKMWEEVADGEMPLWLYTLPRPAARLSAEDKDLLRAWVGETAEGPDEERRGRRRRGRRRHH